MNRRSLLSLLGLTPVAIATGAASAETPNQIRSVRGLSAICSQRGDDGFDKCIEVAPLKESEIIWDRSDETMEFARLYRAAKARRLIP